MANTIVTSNKFQLNLSDWAKGLLMAVATPVVAIIADSLNQGSLTFNWKLILISALSGGLAYIMKNFLSPSRIIVTGETKENIDAVKEGNKEVTVK